jgi:ribonuclease HII
MMQKAIIQLFDSMEMGPERIKFVVSDAMPLTLHTAYTHEKLELAHFPKGERISATIAAASIVAKVTRDRMMETYESLFPHHGLAKHKGYATKDHIAAIRTHGPTIFHRTSFLTKIQTHSESHEEQNNLF